MEDTSRDKDRMENSHMIRDDKQNKKIEEIRDALGARIKEIEREIVSHESADHAVIKRVIGEVDEILERIAKIESVSEYMILEKHTAVTMAVRVLILCKMVQKGSEVDKDIEEIQNKHKTEMLAKNIRVCNGEIDKKRGVLAESLYINMQRRNIALLRKVEASRAMKVKIAIKSRIAGREEEIDTYMKRKANEEIDRMVRMAIPITKETTQGRISEILEGILETGDSELISGLLQLNMGYASTGYTKKDENESALNIKNILLRLTILEPEAVVHEKEKEYGNYTLVLRLIGRYIKKEKMESGADNGREILDEVFDEEEIDMMIKLIEKELPGGIQAEILNILVEGGIKLYKPENIVVTQQNIYSLMKYMINNEDSTDALLCNIMGVLEIEAVDDEEQEEEERASVYILEFFNTMLKRYITGTSQNSISFQKHIASTVIETYNGIIANTANILLVSGYLRLMATLIGVGGDERRDAGERSSTYSSERNTTYNRSNSSHGSSSMSQALSRAAPYYSNVVNMNIILTRNINVIIMLMRQISMFVVQGDHLYVDTCTMTVPDTRIESESEEVGYRSSEIESSITALFKIIMCLPDIMKVTMASGHLMNIIFRKLVRSDCGMHESMGGDREYQSRMEDSTQSTCMDVLYFVRRFFSCKAVVQKISNSIGNNFFVLTCALVNKGELETVHEILANNKKLYRGFYMHKIMTPEIVHMHKQNPVLYSIIASMMVYYYTDDSKLSNEAMNRTITEIFDTVLSIMRAHPHITEMLVETREFGNYFKACVVLSMHTRLNVEDMLYLVVKTQLSTSDIDVKKPSMAVLYKSKNKTIAECFYFYHFVKTENVSLVSNTDANSTHGSGKGGMNSSEKEEVKRESDVQMCYNKIMSAYSSNVLKYIALLGLSAKDTQNKPEDCALLSSVELSSMCEDERVLFVNQLYRVLFMTGCVQEGGSGIHMPFAQSLPDSQAVYAYSDMCIRSAIKATESTGKPHTLPISTVSTGSPHLIAAFLYTLHESSPNSAMTLSYIKKMKKYVRDDASVYSRVLSTVVM